MCGSWGGTVGCVVAMGWGSKVCGSYGEVQ